ncbi:Hsp70 family protein [Glycomyces harbinensis]|uniref:Hsp70 protein n=1 Tax=Glycomyces harbinensis TaxID=58114 RepID=A0A1G6Z285_9ACTN|nr:Hsp70 family protein [Glycomyces harbinensis]SDD96740.1 Hsp70 protein [Glycomyces harbinensis]
MPADYLLSVDLGTSHTVAVVVWPDGRTRPLLFDGSPVMSSAVFLDPSGAIHTGRDAERLGLTAPERFEPNPKHRVSDGTMLLGDREIPVTAAFAAILSRVARTAIESVGHLPNAVLTCPAAWSEQRRGALHDAAAQAGYRPVKILTEPVAAAHYYTSRLSHPLAPGQALAVFDFGGGTLDIAVLERRQDGSFGVLADGGLHDLGGLDFDAALVAHIGITVRQKEPEIWQRLEQPSGASEMRNRRELWEEVRAAKEMLSRSSVAPVTVPDMAQSLHLTRGELDQISRPLLSRAVGETQRVLGLTGRRPEQLAGLFLVGGSSRMPMVSKMLHEGLGIAPTVLEQPELPVSEGAALAMTTVATVTPPVTVTPPAAAPASPPQYSPVTQAAGSLPPLPPASDETIALRRSAPEAPKRRIPRKWIAIGVVVVLLGIAIPLGLWWMLNPYKQRPFAEELTEVGSATAFSGEVNDGIYEVRVWDDKTLFAYTTSSSDASGEELHVRAVDTATGEPLWSEDKVFPGGGWDNTYFVSEELISFSQEVEADGGTAFQHYFLDWDSGETRNTVTSPARDAARSGDLLVIAPLSGNTFNVYDADGEDVAEWELGDAEESVTTASWDLVGSPDDIAEPAQTVNGDGRVWALTSDNVLHVYEIESGDLLAEREVETVEDHYFAWDGKVYVGVVKTTGYDLNVYDIENDLDEVDSEEVESGTLADYPIKACGAALVCVREPIEDLTDVYTWRVYDADGEKFVHEFEDEDGGYGDIEPLGDRLMVEYYAGDDLRTQIFDKGFDKENNSLEETYDAIDGGSALTWPSSSGFATSTGNVIGLGRDGSRSELRTGLEAYACDASDTHLSCLTLEGMQVYSFRDK